MFLKGLTERGRKVADTLSKPKFSDQLKQFGGVLPLSGSHSSKAHGTVSVYDPIWEDLRRARATTNIKNWASEFVTLCETFGFDRPLAARTIVNFPHNPTVEYEGIVINWWDRTVMFTENDIKVHDYGALQKREQSFTDVSDLIQHMLTSQPDSGA